MKSQDKLVFLFPGQGSQHSGMGKYLFDNFKSVQYLFEEASEAIHLDMKKLCFDASENELALTENTQPALLLVSTATQHVLTNHFGVQFSFLAGHSIGEYAALVASHVFSFATGIKAVRHRGQSMQSAVPIGKGGMIATLGLSDEQAVFLCNYVTKESSLGPLSPANFNCPGQIVLSGSIEAIDWLKKNYNPEFTPEWPRKSKLISLNVSAPFHCEMMRPAEKSMAQFFENVEFKNSSTPIIQNFTAEAEVNGLKLKENLIKQVSAPVLWTQSIQKINSLGVGLGIECGASRVLAGLVKKISGEKIKMFSTTSLEDLKAIEVAAMSNWATSH